MCKIKNFYGTALWMHVWRVSCPIQETLLKPKKFVIENDSSPMFESNQTNPDVYDKKIRKLKCWLLKTLSASDAGH